MRFSRSFVPQENRGTIFSRETCNFNGCDTPKVGDAARLVMGKATSAEDAALAPLGVNSGAAGAAGGGGGSSGWECYFKCVLGVPSFLSFFLVRGGLKKDAKLLGFFGTHKKCLGSRCHHG